MLLAPRRCVTPGFLVIQSLVQKDRINYFVTHVAIVLKKHIIANLRLILRRTKLIKLTYRKDAMKKLIISIVCIVNTCTWAAEVEDQSLQRAEQLHQQSCTQCHSNEVYIRKDRMIHSLAALSSRVKQCEVPAKAKWSEADTNAVVNFLNQRFYKF